MKFYYMPGDLVYPTVVTIAGARDIAVRRIAKELKARGYPDILTDHDAPDVVRLTREENIAVIEIEETYHGM